MKHYQWIWMHTQWCIILNFLRLKNTPNTHTQLIHLGGLFTTCQTIAQIWPWYVCAYAAIDMCLIEPLNCKSIKCKTCSNKSIFPRSRQNIERHAVCWKIYRTGWLESMSFRSACFRLQLVWNWRDSVSQLSDLIESLRVVRVAILV